MKVINTKPSDYTIAGKHVVPANGIKTFDDGLWAELKKRPAVQHWLANGHLKEVATEAATPAGAGTETPDASEPAGDVQPATEAATPRRGGRKPGPAGSGGGAG